MKKEYCIICEKNSLNREIDSNRYSCNIQHNVTDNGFIYSHFTVTEFLFETGINTYVDLMYSGMYRISYRDKTRKMSVVGLEPNNEKLLYYGLSSYELFLTFKDSKQVENFLLL